MKAVGEVLTHSTVRKDPTLCAAKEKEGVFNMEREQAIVDQMTGQALGIP
jgi:hypothetical protein